MDALIVAVLFVVGWLIGAFINYASDVLPQTRRFTPALCAGCSRARGAVDYLLMKPCSNCGQRRAVRAWIVQAAAATAVIAWWYTPTETLSFLEGLVLLVYFGIVVVIDLEHRLILHPVSQVGGILALVIGTYRHGLVDTLLGGLAGGAVMLSLYGLGFLFARFLGRLIHKSTDEEALGFGDVALSAVLGLLLGWPGIIGGLVWAVLLGGAGSLLVLLVLVITRRYQAFIAIPYGPFLVLAAVLVIIRPLGVLWI